MKKTYINPTMKVVKIQTNQLMITASVKIDKESTTTTMDARGSRFSRWEEDDFESEE